MLLFSFTIHAQDTFYWFGGSGNWSDINKWSLTSGNSGNELAPRVPTINDNVVFDDNSFPNPAQRNVSITAASFARDFLVQTSPTATAPNFTGTGALTVSGHFIFQPHATWGRGANSTTTLQSNGNHDFDPAGATLNEAFRIEGSGVRNLLGDLTAMRITLASGTFITNGHTIYLSSNFNQLANSHLYLGDSEISVSYWDTNAGATATVDAGTSHITVRLVNNGTINSGFLGYPGQAYHDVTFTGTGAMLRVQNGTFRNVTYANQGRFTILQSHTFENLTLAPGSSYSFANNMTQTITGTFIATTPDCVGLMNLSAGSVEGVATSTINVSSGGTVNMANVRIMNMTATGATFNVEGIDEGGNTGWNFTEPAPKTMYWVGDALDGDWNNAENWAETSGGTGGYCVPTQFDNVIFDNNSDASVQITAAANMEIYCHDITVTGWTNGTLRFGGNGTMNIYGASTWLNGMSYALDTYYRSADPGEVLTFDGVEHHANTYFWGAGGWIFDDAFSTNTTGASTRRLYLVEGTLNTNDQTVYLAGDFYSSTSSNANLATLSKTLILGSSELNVNNWRLGWNLGTAAAQASLTLDAGTSHIIVRNGGNLTQPGFNPTDGKTYYNVTSVAPLLFFGGRDVSFNVVTIEGSANFMVGTKTYHTLNLADARVYNFANNTNQIILDALNSNTPDCAGMTEFRGTGNAAITKASGTVHIPNVLMENMTGAGGAAYTATGVDLGNNTGWSFVSPTPKDLYWIGGTGDWNDAANWTENNDGTPSGGCIPTQYDNVFFNQYSGPNGITVTIAETPAYAHDITWLPGAPENAILTGTSTLDLLNIHGSYTMGQNMTHSIITHFLSDDAGETITFNGSQITGWYVVFDGGGGWQFQDDAFFMTVNVSVTPRDLIFTRGTLDFGGHNVALTGFSSTGTGQRHLIIEDAQIISNHNSRSWTYSGTNNTLAADNSHIDMLGQSAGFQSSPGLQWHDVTMRANTVSNASTIVTFNGGTAAVGSTFNHVRFLRNVSVSGSNTFNTLEVAQTQRIIRITNGTTQTINEMLYISGTPCQPNTIQAVSGTGYLNVLDGNTEFDYVTVQNIDATGGQHLTFHRNSTNGGNNSNMTFETGSGGLIGLGEDWLCHVMDLTDPDTYTLNAGGFFGGPDSEYSWTKIGDPDHPGVLGTGLTLDISTFGYGTYRVVVDYGGGSSCVVQDNILITPVTDPPVVNSTHTQEVCKGNNATVAQLVAEGQNIRWYAEATGGTALPIDTALIDGATYYATQTIDDCESERVDVTVVLKNCGTIVTNPVLINTAK